MVNKIFENLNLKKTLQKTQKSEESEDSETSDEKEGTKLKFKIEVNKIYTE